MLDPDFVGGQLTYKRPIAVKPAAINCKLMQASDYAAFREFPGFGANCTISCRIISSALVCPLQRNQKE